MGKRMIPAGVRKEISFLLGSGPRRYVVPSLGGDVETDCECWDLPPLKEKDKPIHVRYREISARILALMEAGKADAGIEPLIEQANEMIRGVPVTRRFGTPLVSMTELLKLDQWKGMRKEWWELRDRFIGQDVRIFLGYRGGNAAIPPTAEMLIAMPSPEPYDFLRIHETRGNNRPIDTEGIIAALKKLNAEFGVAILSAAEDSAEFVFERPVEAAKRAAVRRRLSRLCPSAEALSEGIRLGRVALWWD